MSIFSGIIKKQCLKEYEKELSRQQFSFEQWKAMQPALEMDDRLKSAAILYGDYMWQGSAQDSAQVPVFLPDFGPNRWDYEDYLGRAVYIREDYYRQIDWEKTSRRAGLKQIIELAARANGKRSDAVIHVRHI